MPSGYRDSPVISEIVTLLAKLSPNKYQDLNVALSPKHPDLLTEGMILGSDDINNIDLVDAKAEIAIAAMEAAVTNLDAALAKAKTTIKRIRNIRIAGQLASLISGSAVLGAEILGAHRWTIAAAAITLIASATTVITEHLASIESKSKLNIQDLYDSLVECAYPARKILSELKILRKFKNQDELSQKISEANSLCEQINRHAIHLI